MKYRSDVDGLRSVAVLSVMAYHYFPPVLHGGFIGVDIFFVISGYLISGIIFDEIAANDFSILRFYRRRINRIFPALSCVLLCCLLFGWIALFPDEFKSLGKNVVASTTFLENIYLWFQSGYFDSDSAKKPLLHIWSLGVEEQFYIIYPPMLLIASRMKILNERFLLLCCGVSLVASLIILRYSETADFYLPLTRYWELSAGGLLAWRERDKAKVWGALPQFLALRPSLASGGGMLAILAGFFLIDAQTPFPGLAAMLPVIGAVLIIGASSAALPNRLLLSNRAAVFVGKISYPLYLWHWPLIAFLYIVNIEKPEPPIRLVLVALSFALATVTWLFVETPIRKRHNNGRTAVVLLTIMTAITGIGLFITLQDGVHDRAVNRINKGTAIQASGIDSPPLPVHDCGVTAEVAAVFRNCVQQPGAVPHFVLLGDSKADALYHGLMNSALPGGGWLYLGGADATTFGAPAPLISDNPAWSRVQFQSRKAIDYIVGNKDIHLVLYAVALRNVYQLDDNGGAGRLLRSYDYHFLSRLKDSKLAVPAEAAVKEAVGRLVAGGKTVAILADNPPLPPVRSCDGRLTVSSTLNGLLGLRANGSNPDCFYPKARFREDAKVYFDMLNSLKQAYGDKVIILDYSDFYCQDQGGQVCGTAYGGHAIYGYTDHISADTASLIGKLINKRLRDLGQR